MSLCVRRIGNPRVNRYRASSRVNYTSSHMRNYVRVLIVTKMSLQSITTIFNDRDIMVRIYLQTIGITIT